MRILRKFLTQQLAFCISPVKSNGFTLLEMVITIALTGIVAGLATLIILNPMRVFVSVSDRVELVDNLEYALQLMARDIRSAVPNSLRVDSNQQALEFVHVAAGFRYRTSGAPNTALQFDAPDDHFHLLGSAALDPDQSYRLVIYNTGEFELNDDQTINYNAPISEVNVYAASSPYHVMTPASTEITLQSAIDNETPVELSTPHQFRLESRLKRAYLVDTPVTYWCDLVNKKLIRYSQYAIEAVQPNQGSSSVFADAVAEELLDGVSECAFQYQSSLVLQAPVVSLEIGVTSAHGETVKLIKRLQVRNAS